jgi:transposase, IS5 family
MVRFMRYRTKKNQGGLWDYINRRDELAKRGGSLDRLNEAVDWELFRPVLEEAVVFKNSAKGGRPPWDVVLMFKILVLQKFYGLSDEQTEYQILDRFSFQRFLGLDAGDGVPDAKTLWVFKERLGEEGARKLFRFFDTHLRGLGWVSSQGKIIDASFVEAPRQRNSREENARIKEGERPESFDEKPERSAQKDTDARWTKKNNEVFYGYKNHAKVDLGSKFVEDFKVSEASLHDSQVVEGLVEPGDGRIFADSAYKSEKTDQFLEKQSVENFIHEKAHRGKPLIEEQKRLNTAKSKLRCRIEHVFGRLRQMGADRFKRIGIARAEFEVGLGNLVYNLDRYAYLAKRGGACTK